LPEHDALGKKEEKSGQIKGSNRSEEENLLEKKAARTMEAMERLQGEGGAKKRT